MLHFTSILIKKCYINVVDGEVNEFVDIIPNLNTLDVTYTLHELICRLKIILFFFFNIFPALGSHCWCGLFRTNH